MREAAIEIALIGDDYALSLAERARRALRRGLSALRRSLAGRRPPPLTAPVDPRRLADLGLSPHDLGAADARSTVEERWRRV